MQYNVQNSSESYSMVHGTLMLNGRGLNTLSEMKLKGTKRACRRQKQRATDETSWKEGLSSYSDMAICAKPS